MERRSRPGPEPLLPASVALTALLALLSGCSSSGSAAPPPVVPSSTAVVATTSASATPTVAAPVLPEAAKQPTRPGAEAFFRYFIDVYSYSYVAQDTSQLRAISASDCTFCNSVIDGVESARTDHQRSLGGGGTVGYVVAAPGEPTRGLLVNAIVDQAASQLVDADGKVVESGAASPQLRMDAAVRWTDNAWQMRDIHVLAKAKK